MLLKQIYQNLLWLFISFAYEVDSSLTLII